MVSAVSTEGKSGPLLNVSLLLDRTNSNNLPAIESQFLKQRRIGVQF